MIDLHIHTVASDGEYSPQKIFQLARRDKLKAIAFCDHDSVGSVTEGFRLSQEFGIPFLSGIELTTVYEGTDLHILGYYLDHTDEKLHKELADIAGARREQAFERVKKLQSLGFIINKDDVTAIAQGRTPDGTTIFKALKSHTQKQRANEFEKYVSGEKSRSPILNFFTDYLAEGGPAYCPVRTISAQHAIEIIMDLGGFPVLAHPGRMGAGLIEELVEKGLMGVEVFSSSHTVEQTIQYERLCLAKDLLITAGSDYHGPHIKPGVLLNGFEETSYTYFKMMEALHQKVLGI